MDSLTPENKIIQPQNTENTEQPSNLPSTPEDVTKVVSSFQEPKDVHPVKNVYPIARHVILILCVLMFLAVIVLLMLLNGKSIYDNGI
jgi:type IV secretory pathway component VirB8